MSKQLRLKVATLLMECFFGSTSVLSLHKGSGKRLILSLIFLQMAIVGYGQLDTEDFESGIPAGWSTFGNITAVSNWAISSDAYQGTNAVSVNPSADNIGAGNTAQYFLATPSITLPANSEIRFYSKRATSGANDNTTYQIKLSTASPDIADFTTTLQTWSGNELNVDSETQYEEKIVAIPESIPAGLTIYVAFVVENTQSGATPNGDEWFIDNIRLIEGCSQVQEADVAISNITTEGANISWVSSVSNFEIQVVEQGVLPSATGEVVGNSYMASGLNPETSYDVYIKTVCDAETASAWAGPFAFATEKFGMACDAPIVITASAGSPYLLTDNLMYYPNAEDTVYSTQGTSCLPTAVTDNYLLGDKIFFTYTPDEDGLITLTQMTHPWTSGTECWGNAYSGVFIYESCSMVGVECLAGLYTTATSQPKKIENFQVTAGTEYTIVMSTNLSAGASICFDFNLSFTTCPTPSVFSYANLLQESVTFSWNNPASISDSWEYAVVPATDPAPTAAGTPTATNENVDISGLIAGTAYNLYVRPVCGGTPGEWSAPYAFTTQCDVFSTPYSTDFVGSTATNPEPCWTSIDVNGDGVKWSYQAGWEDGYLGYATLNTSTNQNFNHDYLVSPQVNFDGIIQKRLRYSHQVGWGGPSSYSIRISTTGIGVDNFTYELVPETVIANESWEEVIYNIPESITGDVNIAWVVSPLGSGQVASRVSITNVFIEDKPACPDPLLPALVEGSETETTAQFTWTQGDVETQWEVLVLPINDPEPDETAIGTITSSSNPYTAEELNPATRYKFYVRAYCNSEEQSNWVGPVEFITSCVVFDTPFYESFDDSDNDTHKFCWTTNDANMDGTTWTMDVENALIQGSSSWFNPTTGYDDWLISPPINAVGNKELRFDYRARYSIFATAMRYGLQVLISYTDTDPASFEELIPLEVFTNTDYLEKSAYFQANGVIYIAFRVPPDFVIEPGTSILDIDNVYIDEAPPCPAPDNLMVQNITTNSANFTWAEGFLEEEWDVVVQEAGTGTPSAPQATANESSYSIDTLNPSTTYEFYVRAKCDGDAQSGWVGPLTFTTLCPPFATPFVETFNSNSESESCWRIVNGNSDDFTFGMAVTLNPYEGDEAAGMFTGTNGANDDWLISPTITVTTGQRLRYFYRVNSSDFEEDLEILISTNGVETDQFTTVLYNSDDDPVVINNVTYLEKIINLPDGITGDINIAWHIPERDPNPWGYRGQIFIVDNVIVEDIPECPEPYNFEVVNVYDTSVEIDWDVAGTETQWEVVVQPSGTDAPGNSPIAEYTYTADSHPFTVEGLDPAFSYDVYVRAICGTDYKWVGPIEFTTFCSYENLCEYTVTLTGPYYGVGGGIDVIQNGNVIQTLEFPTGAWTEEIVTQDYIIYLCEGVEFSFFWDSIGTAPDQYPMAFVELTNSSNEEVWTSEMGIGTPRTVLYSGISICSDVSCPQPTDLSVNEMGALSWTAGGTETSWEVFIQPYASGTLPQSGTVVNTNSYSPVESDFSGSNTNTYEYFVRAVCGGDDESFWSGPYPFVINDDKSNAIALSVSDNEESENQITVSLINSTPSADALACEGLNNGDIWYEFVATSPTHLITLNDFSGNYDYSSGDEWHAPITLALYSESEDVLTDVACSSNNAIATLYSTELTVGETYKLRVILNYNLPSTYTFNVCVRTITDPCVFGGINGSFEDPIGGPNFNFMNQNVTYGWRNANIFGYWDLGVSMYIGSINTIGVTPIDGSQFMQMLSSEAGYVPDLNTAVDGLYQDFDTSETTAINYSFLHASRSGANNVKLYAGPPEGPFVELYDSTVSTFLWQTREGAYEVPEGQTVTRFVFRPESDSVGNLLDGISIVADNSIITEPQAFDCSGVPVAVEANGVGTWTADASNPSETTIEDPTSSVTSISGFAAPGDYTFHWNTRYCEESIVFTYNGFTDVPTVTSPVEYCLNETATALTATATTGYTLLWYTEAVGGTGSGIAPTPDTSVEGSTTYYVVNVNENGCEGERVAIEVVVNPLLTPVLGFEYGQTSYCELETAVVQPSLEADFTIGGTFTSEPAGLSIDAMSGAIDLSASNAGSYTVTYDLGEGNCYAEGTSSVSIEITTSTLPVVEFGYDETIYCQSGTNPVFSPSADFDASGIFEAVPSGLTIDSASGEIDLSTSEAGDYEITYSVEANNENCTQANTFTYSLSVVESPDVVISDTCDGTLLILSVDGSYQDYVWTNANGEVIGSDADFNVTAYLQANNTVMLPMVISVEATTSDLCVSTGSFEVDNLSCVEIPRGISPNGDNLNDTFDLRGIGVRKLMIYNRYGTEVYSFKGSYSNQWYGQDKNGNELPVATYFYSIETEDGNTLTGWVYINR